MYYGYIIRVIKSRTIRLAGHTARMGDKYLQGVVVACVRRILQEMKMDGVDHIHLLRTKASVGVTIPVFPDFTLCSR
jgi:hypothetical protein